MVELTKNDLKKVMERINTLMGENYITMEEFSLQDKQYLSYHLPFYNNNIDKVLDALF